MSNILPEAEASISTPKRTKTERTLVGRPCAMTGTAEPQPTAEQEPLTVKYLEKHGERVYKTLSDTTSI